MFSFLPPAPACALPWRYSSTIFTKKRIPGEKTVTSMPKSAVSNKEGPSTKANFTKLIASVPSETYPSTMPKRRFPSRKLSTVWLISRKSSSASSHRKDICSFESILGFTASMRSFFLSFFWVFRQPSGILRPIPSTFLSLRWLFWVSSISLFSFCLPQSAASSDIGIPRFKH